MYELEKETMRLFKEINNAWVTAFKTAKKEGRKIDLSFIIVETNDKLTELNQKFEECKVRQAKAYRLKTWFDRLWN